MKDLLNAFFRVPSLGFATTNGETMPAPRHMDVQRSVAEAENANNENTQNSQPATTNSEEPKKAKSTKSSKKSTNSKKPSPSKAPKNNKKPKKKVNNTATSSAASAEKEVPVTQTELINEPNDKAVHTPLDIAETPVEQSTTTNQDNTHTNNATKNALTAAQEMANSTMKEINADRKKFALISLITLAPILSLIAIYLNPLTGVYMNAIALATLAVIAMKYEYLRKLSISVAILPVVHLYNLAVPQQDLLLRTVIIYSLLLLLTLTYRYLFTLDAPKKAINLGAIIAFQALLIFMIILGQWQHEAIQTYYPFGIDSASLTVFVFILLAIIEEMYFRGLVQANAIIEAGKKSSVVIASLLFGFSFMGQDMPWSLILGLLFGALLSILYVIRQNLILNIAANMSGKLLLIGLLSLIG